MAQFEIALSKDASNATRITLYQCGSNRLVDDEPGTLESHLHPAEVCEKSDTLDNSSDFKTKCTGHAYQRTQFGRDAKTRIAEATGAMQRNDPKPWNYLFLTGTLPGNTEWSKWAIAEYSPWIVNCMKAWLSKRYNQRMELYVWEMQTRGALHFHWLLYCPDPAMRRRITEEFRLEWVMLLEGVEKMSGIPMWGRHSHLSPTAKYCIVQVKVEEVRESVAKYMAGYCGTKKDKHQADAFIPYYPKRWFGVCRTLSSLCKEHAKRETFTFRNYREAKIAFDEMGHYFDQYVDYAKKYPHNVGRGETSIHYHTPEIQDSLWQARKAMIYNPQTHPLIWSMITVARSVGSMCSQLETSSKWYTENCSRRSREVLSDTLYLQSLRRGSLRMGTIAAAESLYLELSSRSPLPPSIRPLYASLETLITLHSRYYSQMRWNQHGWLNNSSDFEGKRLHSNLTPPPLDPPG